MGILEHLEELRHRIFVILWFFMPVFLFYMLFSIRFADVGGGLVLPYPWPDLYDAVSVHVVRFVMSDLLPTYVEAVQFNPWEAILVQVKVAAFLALLTTLPVIVFELTRFVSPGLYTKERRLILRITVPATLLFAAGVVIAYLWILPFTFDFLYGIGLGMGLTPFVGPDQFFDLVLLFLVGMGLGFQTPVIMWGLTALGVIEPGFWKRNWRYAFVGFFIFGAVITPDGSGVTMLLVAVPMTILYLLGYLAAVRTWNRKRGEPPASQERPSSFPVWSVVIVLIVAVTGGFVYFGQGLLQPPQGMSNTWIGEGNATVTLPALALFAPLPEDGIHTGTFLRITNETHFWFNWSASAGDGRPVSFESEEVSTPGLSIEGGGSSLRVLPALWNESNVTSLELSVTDGHGLVYALDLQVEYRVALRRTFADANANGVLDPGEAVLREAYVIVYSLVPGAATQRDPQDLGIAPPAGFQAQSLRRGLFSSAGPGWNLEAHASDFGTVSGPFEYVTRIETGAPGVDLTLFLTRSYTWAEGEDQVLWIRGDATTQFGYEWLLDLRFGTLLSAFDSP